jgi:hypothetical protein
VLSGWESTTGWSWSASGRAGSRGAAEEAAAEAPARGGAAAAAAEADDDDDVAVVRTRARLGCAGPAAPVVPFGPPTVRRISARREGRRGRGEGGRGGEGLDGTGLTVGGDDGDEERVPFAAHECADGGAVPGAGELLGRPNPARQGDQLREDDAEVGGEAARRERERTHGGKRAGNSVRNVEQDAAGRRGPRARLLWDGRTCPPSESGGVGLKGRAEAVK